MMTIILSIGIILIVVGIILMFAVTPIEYLRDSERFDQSFGVGMFIFSIGLLFASIYLLIYVLTQI